MSVAWLIALAVVIPGCGDNKLANTPFFAWDRDQRAVGAYDIDHLAPDNAPLLAAIDDTTLHDEVTVFYGHAGPDATLPETIDAILTRADEDSLPIYTFEDLVAGAGGPSQAGIALSFDDTEIDDWWAWQEIFDRHHARATYFVTEYYMFTDEGRTRLHALYDAGHAIEAHGVHHERAETYIAEHGLQAYLDDEVQPSIDVLRADGFAPVAYAHPNGSHTPELDEALEDRIALSRTISGRPK